MHLNLFLRRSFVVRFGTGGRFLFLASLALVMSACSRSHESPQASPDTVLVQVVKPQLPAGQSWSGVIRSKDRASLSFPTGGRIARVCVEVGDQVSKGAVLVELDQEPFELALAQAKAEVQAATPLLVEAQRRLDAEERLWTEAATSRVELDVARTGAAAAKARLQSAEAALGLARKQLRDSVLLAPVSGRVAQRMVQTATWIAPGTPVLEFDGDGPSEAHAWVSGTAAARLAIGQEVTVTSRSVQGDGAVHKAVISNISKRSMAGGSYELVVRLPAGFPANPGEPVQVSLGGEAAKAALMIPLSAVLPSGEMGAGHVLVFNAKTSRLERRELRYQSPQGAAVVVCSGVQAGDSVVVAGAGFLRDGQLVVSRPRD